MAWYEFWDKFDIWAESTMVFYMVIGACVWIAYGWISFYLGRRSILKPTREILESDRFTEKGKSVALKLFLIREGR